MRRDMEVCCGGVWGGVEGVVGGVGRCVVEGCGGVLWR